MSGGAASKQAVRTDIYPHLPPFLDRFEEEEEDCLEIDENAISSIISIRRGEEEIQLQPEEEV